MRLSIVLIALFMPLILCAQQPSTNATTAVSAPVADKSPATIYVFARRDAPSRSWYPVFCDSALVAELKRGKFFAIKVAPGRHMIIGEDGTPSVIDAHSGEEYFIRLERGFVVGPSGRTDIFLATTIRPTDAKKDLNYLSYIDADKIRSGSVTKEDPTLRSRPELKKRPVEGNSESK